MENILYIILLGFIFSNVFKVVDLIDEHLWIENLTGFILKSVGVGIVVLSIFGAIIFDRNFLFHFSSIFLFWIIKNKMEFPSHVIIMFLSGIIIGHYLDINIYSFLIILIFTFLYLFFDFLVGRIEKNNFIYLFLYKRLGRFYIVSFLLSFFLNDYYIFLHSCIGLISMEAVRYLITKRVIKIKK